jgi:beta-N-acetylhexosaminidase
MKQISALDPGVLSLEEKVGQLFLLAFEGASAREAKPLLRDCFVGSVYLSQDNLTGVDQAVQLLCDLQDTGAATPHALPILAACDQEGAWSVLNPYSTAGPGALALGAARSDLIEAMFAVIGRELRVLGISADLAPVADVNCNPRNPIIGSRSFGGDAKRVAEAVEAAVRGLHRGGVVACAKHFPGHGDTAQDSHQGAGVVVRDAQQIRNGDLIPFRAAIAAGVDMIMTAHLLYPAFDPEWPATLSPAILQNLLRQELGFTGVILTDSFSMGAIRRLYDPAEAAIRAINAGADMIMLAEERYGAKPEDYLRGQITLIEKVRAAARGGVIPPARLNEAVNRVLALKAAAGLFPTAHPRREEAVRVVGCAAHRAVELEAARAAVAVVRNRDGRAPLALAAGSRLVVVSPVDPAAYQIFSKMRGIGPNIAEPPAKTLFQQIQRRHASSDLVTIVDAGAISRYREILRSAAAVIVATENYPLPGFRFPAECQRAVIEGLLAAGLDPVIIGLRDPYELLDLPAVRTYISAFGYAPVCSQAAVEVLFGERPAEGRLPVEIS